MCVLQGVYVTWALTGFFPQPKNKNLQPSPANPSHLWPSNPLQMLHCMEYVYLQFTIEILCHPCRWILNNTWNPHLSKWDRKRALRARCFQKSQKGRGIPQQKPIDSPLFSPLDFKNSQAPNFSGKELGLRAKFNVSEIVILRRSTCRGRFKPVGFWNGGWKTRVKEIMMKPKGGNEQPKPIDSNFVCNCLFVHLLI